MLTSAALPPLNEPLSQFLFVFLALFGPKHLTVEATEILLEAMNVVLSLVGMTYRFPVKANTFKSASQLKTVCCSGIRKYAVCKGCHGLYPSGVSMAPIPDLCNMDDCRTPLLLPSRTIPAMVYSYNSAITTLKRFFLRPTFVNSLTQWKTRNYNDDMLFDIYDGRVWQEFGADNGRRPFVQQSDFNIMLTINIDWFQPFVGTQHSSGGVYITIQNLPRAERNQKKNVICAAILPGPKEPKTTEINSYLAPLVDELQMLFQGVFMDVVVDGVVQRKKVRAAVTLVACDLPAARKLCGFTSPSSNCACHKCQNQFGSLMTDRHRRNFTNFDVSTWIPRTLENHRRNALLWKRAPTAAAKQRVESAYGTRYSELLRLEYFDPIRFTVVDPMHNLYLGTAKRMMTIWRTATTTRGPMLTDEHLKQMAVEAQDFAMPYGYDSTSLIKKMNIGEQGFSHLKADEWKIWVIALSKPLLLGKLDDPFYKHWLKFVEANRLIASPSVSREDIEAAHALLLSFCTEMEQLYGPASITPNMHFHIHLKEGLLDYGPAYGYWVFNFERYNGDVKNIDTNRKGSFESTYMENFLYAIHGLDYLQSFNISPDTVGYHILHRLVNKEVKQLNQSPMQKEVEQSLNSFNINTFVGLAQRESMMRVNGSEALPLQTIGSIKLPSRVTDLNNDAVLYNCIFHFYSSRYGPAQVCPLYRQIQPGQVFVDDKIIKFKSIEILGQKYKAATSTSSRGSFICAFMPGNDGNPVLHPGQIQFFFCHVFGDALHTFAFIKWYKPTPLAFQTHRLYGMDTWSNDFEEASSNCILPVHRIHSPIGIYKWLRLENINVIIPFPRRIAG